MVSHPLYERPEEDQGRKSRTGQWTESEIIEFLNDQYEDPLDEFEADDYAELSQKVNELGLAYDEESDWRYEQIPDLGEKNFDYGITCYPMRLEDGEERPPKPDDYVPVGVRLEDENGDVQVEYENK